MTGRVLKRSVLIAGHATSISLEQAFWQELTAAAKRRSISINRLIGEIDATRAPGDGNLSSALRVFLLNQARGNPPTSS